MPALFLIGAVAASVYVALTSGHPGGPLAWAIVAIHVLAPIAALLLLRRRVSLRAWQIAVTVGGFSLLAGAAVLIPGLSRSVRAGLVSAHVLTGAVALVLPVAAVFAARFHLQRYGLAALCLAMLLGPVGTYVAGERSAFAWQPPGYDAESCYRFLTATTAEQAGSEGFPSGLRQVGDLESGCEQSGCHADMARPGRETGHARGVAGPAYRATLEDFSRRRGDTAAQWCRGCHEPETSSRSVGCMGCHSAVDVNAGHGAAALTLVGGPKRSGQEPRRFAELDVRLRPYSHAARFSNRALLKSAEFCGACHRKHWNLPQNEYRWMEGPDEYRSWQSSHFSGSALFAAGDPQPARSCVGCHDPHGEDRSVRDRPAPLTLDLHFKSPASDGDAKPEVPSASRVTSGHLDVVVHNGGVGHDFPYGMPDLHEAWLAVSLVDGRGQVYARSGGLGESGQLDPKAHVYRLVALDRKGETVEHGQLDEMVSVREWRRIGPGQSDLARYALPAVAPRGSRVVVRLLRRRRPSFAAWVGEKPGPVQVLAEASRPLSQARSAPDENPRVLRRYGMALASVKAYPEALRVLLQARGIDAADGETDLALGRVYLLEGDLLAAQDAFLRVSARPADGKEIGVPSHDRARAWEAAVLRRTGRSDEAARVLAELVRKYPRDRQLRFELGLTRMALLDHPAAAREFEAALDVDPLDSAAHYNLMISQQRLNQLTRARREETIYRLLSDTAPLPVAQPRTGLGEALEATALHIHQLEAVR